MMEEFIEEDNTYLSLSPTPIRFEPASKLTNVFYDDANQQVFAVRSGGATGVVVKGPKESLNSTFRMENKGVVLSIKFSPDQLILAVQRTSHSVEFMNFNNGGENLTEYSQSSRNKSGLILGFIWTAPNEILYIDKTGLELFQVYPEKRMLKFMKNISVPIEWFLHSPESNILVISSTSGTLLPFQLRPGNVHKFPKLDIDLASVPKNPSNGRQMISERDVSIVTLYNKTAVLVLRHKPKASTGSGAEVDVYVLNKDNSSTKSHVLKLDTSGRFAINVIDNLIIVHHQASKTSMLFDVRLSCGSDGFSTYHSQVVVGMPIKSYSPLPLPTSSELECELYSSNWVVFQPNVVIDAKLGALWFLHLHLSPILSLMPHKVALVQFLLQRENGKEVLIQFLNSCLLEPDSEFSSYLPDVLDVINENYRSYLDVQLQSQMALPAFGKAEQREVKGRILLDQEDFYSQIFSIFSNRDGVKDEFIVFVVTEYIRSLTQFKIPVQHFIYELIINALVRQRAFYQLHQFLMCHVVTDSKPLACLLLSLEGIYPPAHQLSLDMFKRLGVANDLIVEVLLNKGKIIPAIRFLQSYGKTDYVQSRKFLDSALRTGDSEIFYSVYKFFEERNLRLRGNSEFEPTELCGPYISHFINTFGKNSAINCTLSSYSE